MFRATDRIRITDENSIDHDRTGTVLENSSGIPGTTVLVHLDGDPQTAFRAVPALSVAADAASRIYTEERRRS